MTSPKRALIISEKWHNTVHSKTRTFVQLRILDLVLLEPNGHSGDGGEGGRWGGRIGQLANSDCPRQVVMSRMSYVYKPLLEKNYLEPPQFSSIPLYAGYWVYNFTMGSFYIYKILS